MVELKEGNKNEINIKLPGPAFVNAMKFLSIVYLMTLLVFSIVLPLSFLLRGGVGVVNSTYLWAFYLYLSLLGIIFLIYVNVKILQLKEKPKYDEEENNKNPTVYTINTSTEQPNEDINMYTDKEREKQIAIEENHNKRSSIENGTEEYNRYVHQIHKDNKRKSLIKARLQPPVQHGGPGVNFFLRLGAIGFALGTIFLDALRITQYFQTPDKYDCYGPLYILQCGARFVMVLLESHFIFKHHKIIINFRHAVMWFGFLHLISANLVMWVGAVIIEAYEGFHHSSSSHEEEHHETENTTTPETGHSVHKRASESSEDLPCQPTGLSMFNSLSHYLYPLVIEFALIGAAVLYKVVTNLGALVNPGYNEWVASNHASNKKIHNHECHKATSGIMWGLMVFTTMFAVTLAFMLSDDLVLNGYLYLGGDLAVHAVALISCIFAFRKVSQLTFAGDVENPIDEYLIVICLAGLYFLTGAKMVAAFDALGDDEELDKFNYLYIVGGFVSFIQASFQVVFIIDGFRREATTRKHQHEKPGRSLISFLLFCNLSMWLINSFQLKETGEATVMRDFYGDLAWTIILYLTLPLAVFFRFHSVVCLSDIWIEAYKKRCHALFKVRPEDIHHDHNDDNKHKNVAAVANDISIVENDLYPSNHLGESDTDSIGTRL